VVDSGGVLDLPEGDGGVDEVKKGSVRLLA
jgi:hypothetical protein